MSEHLRSGAKVDGRRPAEPVSADALFNLLLWVIVAAVIGRLNADPDLWGHLRFGSDMLRDRTLPSIDPYSFTQDVAWVNHEWLSELQMAVAYHLGGVPGLFVLKFLVFAVACGVLARALRHLPVLPRGAVVFVFMWAAAPLAMTMRPQLWSFACAAVTTALLAAEVPSAQLLWLPVVFALWVNLHGGWIVGGLLVAIWAAVRIIDSPWRRWVLAVAGFTVAATLVNPYGAHLWAFLARTVRIGRDAQEWHPLSAAPAHDWWPWLLTVATAALLVARRRVPMHAFVTMFLLAYLSFRVVRLVPFFVLVTALYTAPALSEITRRYHWLSWHPRAPSRAAAALMLVPSSIVVALYLPLQSAPCLVVQGNWVPEPVTARALQLAHPRGKLITEFGWGEYAIWHFGPALRVSMDGRRETVYSDATLREYDDLLAGDPASLDFVEKQRPEYVWLTPARDRLRRWLVANGYRIDVEVPMHAWLAVRSDLSRVMAPNDRTTSGCFPD